MKILHVVIGPAELLAPNGVPADKIAALIGQHVEWVPLFWLHRNGGRFTHSVLLDDHEDRRQETFIRSIAEDFSDNVQPLVVFPELSAHPSQGASTARCLSLLEKLAIQSVVDEFHLHTLKIDETPFDTDWGKIAPQLEQTGKTVHTNVQVCDKTSEIYEDLSANLTANQIAERIIERWRLEDIRADRLALAETIGAQMQKWRKEGLIPGEATQGWIASIAARIDRECFGATDS